VLSFAVPFASFSILCKTAGQNHFAKPNWHVLTFLHPKFAVQCTGGVALRIANYSWIFVYLFQNYTLLRI
jgi:hypothetical protein